MIYNKIYDFCKVRNIGSARKNGLEPTPRVEYLINLLDSEDIKYELDVFGDETKYFNIILRGNSSKMVVAHHDIVNPNIDNANDNSASVINLIAIKKLRPNINAVILDGEEIGGIGSQRLSEQINDGDFGKIDWVLNLELTGSGGKHFFMGNYPGILSDKIIELFECPVINTPFNDSVIFRKNGIDSTVINPLPPLPINEKSIVKFNDVYLNYDLLYNCHSRYDTLDTISIYDMQEFVEEIVLKIID
jgi:hypothetical protein